MFARSARFRLLLPLAYLIAGIAWVVGSDTLLGHAGALGSALQVAAPVRGIAFVLLSAILLYLVQAWPVQRVCERTRELEAAKDAAEHSDRVKSAFLSTMSHELRTPLNSILGFTDVLLQGLPGPLTPEQARQLGIVRESSAHLRDLVEDVLDISRIEAGQISLHCVELDLRALLAQRVDAFRHHAARKGIELRFDAPGDLPTLRSDARRVAQVVGNLVSNAIKFTDAGQVVVALRTRDDRVEVDVTDTGCGIAATELEQIFQPFVRALRPGGKLRDGTGLGLAIARNLARALGGDVGVQSEPGRGSRFTFWLPLGRSRQDAVAA